MERDSVHLLDILISARLIRDFTHGISEEAFKSDILRQDAIIRRIEIIGEATQRLSSEFRAGYPASHWKTMTGMLNPLIHNYDEVDFDQVWDVVQHDIPALIAQITPLVPPDDE